MAWEKEFASKEDGDQCLIAEDTLARTFHTYGCEIFALSGRLGRG